MKKCLASMVQIGFQNLDASFVVFLSKKIAIVVNIFYSNNMERRTHYSVHCAMLRCGILARK